MWRPIAGGVCHFFLEKIVGSKINSYFCRQKRLRIKVVNNQKMNNRSHIQSRNHEALLSNAGGFTAFSFGGYNIRFRAPYSLDRYVDVVKWDDGYLVVLAKYNHNAEPEEEYIDLKPILEGLYIDPVAFLKPIKNVRLAYA